MTFGEKNFNGINEINNCFLNPISLHKGIIIEHNKADSNFSSKWPLLSNRTW